MDIIALKKSISAKYFDYQRLSEAIVGQSNRRRFIGQLIKKGYIVRIKKGLYVWAEQLDATGYSKKILSNLIYGPSYVSLEYALSFYGLIPERVKTVTAVTFKRNKLFKTPVGSFEYSHLYQDAYSAGVNFHVINHAETCLIACPEKALLDYIALRLKRIDPDTSLAQLLADDMRIEQSEFANLKADLLIKFGPSYRSVAVQMFIKKVRNG